MKKFVNIIIVLFITLSFVVVTPVKSDAFIAPGIRLIYRVISKIKNKPVKHKPVKSSKNNSRTRNDGQPDNRYDKTPGQDRAISERRNK